MPGSGLNVGPWQERHGPCPHGLSRESDFNSKISPKTCSSSRSCKSSYQHWSRETSGRGNVMCKVPVAGGNLARCSHRRKSKEKAIGEAPNSHASDLTFIPKPTPNYPHFSRSVELSLHFFTSFFLRYLSEPQFLPWKNEDITPSRSSAHYIKA